MKMLSFAAFVGIVVLAQAPARALPFCPAGTSWQHGRCVPVGPGQHPQTPPGPPRLGQGPPVHFCPAGTVPYGPGGANGCGPPPQHFAPSHY